MLNEGHWLDEGLSSPDALRNWQPEGCMLQEYDASMITSCLKGKTLVFTGDSIVRRIYFATIGILDPSFDRESMERDRKHGEFNVTIGGVQLEYAWDRFLNSKRTLDLLERQDISQQNGGRPALVIMGTGIHELSAFGMEEGSKKYIEAIDRIVEATGPNSKSRPQIADEFVLIPVEHTVPEKLNDYRRPKMQNAFIDNLNVELRMRAPPYTSSTVSDLSVLYALNELVDYPEAINHTTDGLHYDDTIAGEQINLMLNLRCNDVLPKKFPYDATCCMQYPAPNWLQFIFILVALIWAPLAAHFVASGERNWPDLFCSY